MNLELVLQSEVSQKERDKYHILTHIYEIQKKGTEEFTCGEIDKENRFMDMGKGEEKVWCMERIT